MKVVGHRQNDGAGERRAQAALERLPSTFMNEDVGLALREGQRNLRRVDRVGNPQRCWRHAWSHLRTQPTTSHPANRRLKKREDGLSAHQWEPSQDGVWGVPTLVKQALFHLWNPALGGELERLCSGLRNLATGPGFLAEAP